MSRKVRIVVFVLASLAISGCSTAGGGLFGGNNATTQANPADELKGRETIWDLFVTPDPNVNIRVNKYIWNAALDTLSFLPLEGADPFTGVIVMGWGRAPGSSQAYRATVYVQDPALDARSLRLSIQRRAGSGAVAASAETVRQIEDAILTRARQLRIADSKL
jgi:Domain of unknown function (DUF3576)